CDEESRGSMRVGTGEQELRAGRMAELRPFVAQRENTQARGVDDRLVLARVERADGVDDRPARPDALRGGPEQAELELRQRAGAPAEIGAAREHAETRAGRVDERAVVAGQL